MIPAKPQIAALFPKGKRGNVSRAAAGLPERVKSWEALIALGPASSSISSFHFSAGLEETRALLLSCASAEISSFPPFPLTVGPANSVQPQKHRLCAHHTRDLSGAEGTQR